MEVPIRTAVPLLAASALAMAALLGGGVAGEGAAGHAALAHAWHDGGADYGNNDTDSFTCAPWDDSFCWPYAHNATAAYDARRHAGCAPFLPPDGPFQPGHGPHGWRMPPPEGCDAAFLCGMSGPHLAGLANGTDFFAGLRPAPPDVARGDPHGMYGASYEAARAACLPGRPADPMAEPQPWRAGLSSSAAGFAFGMGGGNGEFYGNGGGRTDNPPMPQRSPPAAMQGAGGGLPTVSKNGAQDAGRLPAAVSLRSPEAITDENIQERRPAVNGSGANTVPSVINVTSLTPDGLYEHGKRIEIAVRFTEAVHVSAARGTPYLALDFAGERRAAPYDRGTGSDALVFTYDVRYGDMHGGLNYTGESALSDGGGAITGASGRHADLTLPPTGSPGSLSATSALVLGVAPPTRVPHIVSFGSLGDDDGEFRKPHGVAVSPVDGRIVVADTFNDRIQVFHPNGTFAFKLNSSVLPGGEIRTPSGVAVALDGRIVVAGNGINVFHPNGTFDFKFAPRWPSVFHIAVDPGGRFITDGHVFRFDGTYSHMVHSGNGGVAASATAKLAFSSGGTFFINYANGTEIVSVYLPGIYDGELSGSTTVGFDNADRLVVADAGNHRIQVFHPNGTFAFKFGSPGSADGEFHSPIAVAVSPLDGRIVVADTYNNRIQVFAPTGDEAGGEMGPPAATAATSPSPRGVYGAGDLIKLNVHFTRPVFLSGPPPALALDTGSSGPRNATYAGGNGTAILSFAYEVGPADATDSLEYNGADALALPSAAAAAVSGSDGSTAILTLPFPGQPGSLSYLKHIVLQPLQDGVDGAGVVNVTSLTPDGLYEHGDRIEIAVRFTEAVHVSTARGTPYLALDFAGERRAVQYDRGNGSDTLVFGYDVRYGDMHGGLNYTGESALSDGGGAITGAFGRYADLTLPPPGSPGSLSATSALVLGVAPPTQVPHVVSFGSYGDADGEFRWPYAVAVSPIDGRIVVADRELNRIQVFEPNGTFAFKFGSAGDGEGEFHALSGVAVALDGRIVVVGNHDNRIQVFHPNGTFDFMFLAFFRQHPVYPYDVAVDPGGRFVLPGLVFNPDGTYSHRVPGYAGGVAASATARYVFAHSAHFSINYANGTEIASAYRPGIYDGEVAEVNSIAFDNADRLVVADAGNNRIQVFHPNGTFAFKFGSQGSDDGEFNNLRGVAVSPLDGRIVVVDVHNSRIQVFAPTGGEAGGAVEPPAATAATLPSPRGVYGEGDRIKLNVHFTRPVFLSGQPPVLALDTGASGPGNATYAGGNGTAILSFAYEVGPADATDSLEYNGADALALPSAAAAAVSGADGTAAVLTLPAPGQPGSLSYIKRIVVQPAQEDGTEIASVVNVTSLVPDGLYEHGDRIEIAVRFTEAVHVSAIRGTPYLALDFAGERRAAPYDRGNGSDTLVFGYDVRHGDRHGGLNYTGESALSDGGGTVTSASGRHADLALPTPGSPGSLSASSALVLGIAPPTRVPHVVSFGSLGSGDDEFHVPFDVAVSPLDGRIVVADAVLNRIQVFDSDGTFALGFDSSGLPGGEFEYPYGVAVALDGRIVVADTGNSRIQVFHQNGTFDFNFATHDGERPFDPYDVAIDPGGRLVVAGHHGGTHVFRHDGTYSHEIYRSGNDVATSATAKIAFDGWRISTEYANGAKIVPSHRYAYDGQLGGVGSFAFDNADRLVVSDVGNHRLLVFHPNGTFAFRFGSPGSADGEFNAPRGVAVSPLDGRIVVADSRNHRIQVFAPTGDEAGERRPPSAAAVTSPSPHGVYGTGDLIKLNVHFTRPVFLSGPPPVLTLDAGTPVPRNATYAGGNGTAILKFSYTVQPYDRTSDLEYAGSAALALPGTSVATGRAGSDTADLMLPAPGTPGSLSYSADIRLGGAPAAVVSVLPSAPAHGSAPVTLGAGARVDIDVVFSRPVSVSTSGGVPYLLLRVGDNERTALYVAGEDGREDAAGGALQGSLTFRYEVGTGDFADALEYASKNALVANGSTITGAAGYPADLTLPAPGARGSLSAGSAIAVRAPAAVVDPPTSPPVDPPTSPPVDPPTSPPVDPAPGQPGPGGAHPAPRNMTVDVGPVAGTGPINATDDGDGLRLVLNMTGLANSGRGGGGDGGGGGGDSTLTFPPEEVVVLTSFAEVSFPPSVTATSVPDDGLLALHVSSDVHDDILVQDALAYGGSGRVVLRTVVEVGDGGARVQFDRPVRVSLEGQAGGRAFYAEGANGTIVPIDRICAADDTGRVHRQLGGVGECQLDSDDGDKVIHTYHLTLFGTAASERGAPPPSFHTCSVRLGLPSLEVSASAGARTPAAPQMLINSGSLPFAGVNISATPWRIDLGGGAPDADASPLPAFLTEVSADGPASGYAAVGGDGEAEIAAARGLAGGEDLPLWFRIDLTGSVHAAGTELTQDVAYSAQCGGHP